MCADVVSILTYLRFKMRNAVSQFRKVSSSVEALKAATTHILTEQIVQLLSVNSECEGIAEPTVSFVVLLAARNFLAAKPNHYLKELQKQNYDFFYEKYNIIPHF